MSDKLNNSTAKFQAEGSNIVNNSNRDFVVGDLSYRGQFSLNTRDPWLMIDTDHLIDASPDWEICFGPVPNGLGNPGRTCPSPATVNKNSIIGEGPVSRTLFDTLCPILNLPLLDASV